MNLNSSQETYAKAYRFAAQAHNGQLFPGTELPYIMHVSFVSMEVMATLAHKPEQDGDLAVQCTLLHDVIEDTEVSYEEVDDVFGTATCQFLTFKNPLPLIAQCAIISAMNKRHRKTLESIFGHPTPTSLEWKRIEALFIAVGAKVVEGRGSRVRFELNNVVATFHRPHPQKEAKPYQVRDARHFLEQVGIKP
jgi:hypothetical protein